MSINLKLMMEAVVRVGEMQEIGVTPMGTRRIIPIEGGTFKGPQLEGVVLPGGADWQMVRPDGVRDIEARYTLETNDGVKIYVVNKGLICGNSEQPETFYFTSTPRFEVAGDQYSWLTRKIFLATVEPQMPASVYIKFYQVN